MELNIVKKQGNSKSMILLWNNIEKDKKKENCQIKTLKKLGNLKYADATKFNNLWN